MADQFGYHFNIIYNKAGSPFSRNEDQLVSLEFTKFLVEKLKNKGYGRGYYGDRDEIPGRNVFSELKRVIDNSYRTIVVITPGFKENLWSKYCHQSSFKKLLDTDSAGRFLPVSLGLEARELPEELNVQHAVYFNINNFKSGPDCEESWEKLYGAFEEPESYVDQDGPRRTRQGWLLAQPTDADTEQVERFTDAYLYNLAESFVSLILPLGLKLGFSGDQVNEISRDYQSAREQAYQILKRWKNTLGVSEEEQLEKLINVSREVGRQDVVKRLQNQNELDGQIQRLTDVYLYDLAEDYVTKVLELGVNLGLGTDQIDAIRRDNTGVRDQAYRVLKKWKQSSAQSEQEQMETLINVSRDIGRPDVAVKLQDKCDEWFAETYMDGVDGASANRSSPDLDPPSKEG